jgi:hypothetical protein
VFLDLQAPATTLAMMTDSGRNLITSGLDASLTATQGYDGPTGLGTPNGDARRVRSPQARWVSVEETPLPVEQSGPSCGGLAGT